MSDEQKIMKESIEEEKAPALPTTEPPKDDVGKTSEPEVTEAPKVDEKPAEEVPKEEKPATRIFKRPTLKWGKKRDEPSAPREPEQAKDIREDTLGWIAQQIPPAVHKVNYFLLDWAQKLAYEESERPELPGKDGSMTRNQFLAHLRDGKLLVNLANKLQPGSISVESDVTTEAMVGTEAEKRTETVVEGEKKEEQATESVKIEEKKAATPQKTLKEKQSELINKFTTWANDCLGLGEGKAMTAADLLEKGKAGYPAVFETLWQLAVKAQEKFHQEGINVEAVVTAASQVVRTNIIQSILNFFKRRPSPPPDKKDDNNEQVAGDGIPNAPEGEQVTEEECKKIDTLTSAPVAAN